MSFAAQFLAAAPPEWKKTACHPEDPSRTVEGLFRFEPQDVDFGQAQDGSDSSHLFEVPVAVAIEFVIRVGTVLVFDIGRFRVVSTRDDACGMLRCVLRRYAT